MHSKLKQDFLCIHYEEVEKGIARARSLSLARRLLITHTTLMLLSGLSRNGAS